MAAGQATFRSRFALLCTIPGGSQNSATVILAELSTDRGCFPNAGQLLVWAVPWPAESAGKRKSSQLRKGAPWAKTMLVQRAWAATSKRDSYYETQFNRLQLRPPLRIFSRPDIVRIHCKPLDRSGGTMQIESVPPLSKSKQEYQNRAQQATVPDGTRLILEYNVHPTRRYSCVGRSRLADGHNLKDCC